jgi:hypothetical protein
MKAQLKKGILFITVFLHFNASLPLSIFRFATNTGFFTVGKSQRASE